MVNMFQNAITEALDAEFGYEVYPEDVPQGLVPPCFIVTVISAHRTRENHNLYRHSVLFAVQYFPADEENYRNEIHEVISRLNDCLEIINVEWSEGNIRHTLTENTETAITEGVLSYVVRVEDIYIRTESGDLMEDYELENEVEYG